MPVKHQFTEAHLRKFCNAEVEYAEDKIKAFKEQLDKNPAYAMTWADEVFEAAGKLDAYKQILNWMAPTDDEDVKPVEVERILEFVQAEVISRAGGSLSCSTSPSANLMQKASMQAYARLLHKATRGY